MRIPKPRASVWPIQSDMAQKYMDDTLRGQVNEAVIMESLAENKVIRDYFAANPDRAHYDPTEENATPVTLQDILDYAAGDPDQKNNPHIQILEDYFYNGAGQGSNPADYKILDFKQTREFNGEKTDWETNAVITTPAKDGGEPGLYVAYRGTGGDEWLTNASIMYEESTAHQLEAREYLDSMVERFPNEFKNSYVTLTGHSAGGNKGMYATMTSQYGDYVDSCIVMDAPGYSPELVDKMESDPNFNERRSKITMVCGQYDYVHGLGEPIVDPDKLYYIKTAPAEGDIGERAFSMHLSQYLFKYDIVKDENGNIVTDKDGNPVLRFTSTLEDNADPADFVLAQREFMKDFLSLSREDRKKAAHTIMFLMDQLNGKNVSADGKNIDPEWLATIEKFLNNPHCMSFVVGLLYVLDPDLKMISGLLRENAFLAVLAALLAPIAVPALKAYLKQGEKNSFINRIIEKLRDSRISHISRQEAAENPEFYIDPTILANGSASNTNGRVNASIAMLQKELKKAAEKPKPFRSISISGTAGRGAEFDPGEIARLQAIRQKISRKQSEIKATQDDIRDSVKQLEQIKDTLYAVLSYMANTGNDFVNIENDTLKNIQNWHTNATIKT